jgi:hypothetical protein
MKKAAATRGKTSPARRAAAGMSKSKGYIAPKDQPPTQPTQGAKVKIPKSKQPTKAIADMTPRAKATDAHRYEYPESK